MNIRNKQGKIKNNYKWVGLSVILVLCVFFVVASPLITQIFPTTSPYVTSNDSINISYNFTEDSLKELKFSWDEDNYTLYDSSVIGLWNFDNRSELGEWANSSNGYVKDLSMYNNNISLYKMAINSDYAKSFNSIYSTGGYGVTAPYGKPEDDFFVFSNNQSFTISIWAYRMNIDGANVMWHVNNETSAENKPNSLYAWGSGGSGSQLIIRNSVNSQKTIQLGDFLSNTSAVVTAVYNSSSNTLYAYRDGILKGSQVVGNFTMNRLVVGRIATLGVSYQYGWDGTLDELIVFNRSLSSNEVEQLASSQITKYNNENWSFGTTENLSDMTMNSTNPIIDYEYYLCISNTTSYENCSDKSIISSFLPEQYIIANFSSSIGVVPETYFGIEGRFFQSEYYWIDADNDGTVETLGDYNWSRTAYLNSNAKTTRIDVRMASLFSGGEGIVNETKEFDNFANINTLRTLVKWCYENNKSIILSAYDVPGWLGDQTTGWCSVDHANTCTPSNLTKFTEMYEDLIYEVTSNGLYNASIYLEFYNEPENDQFLNSLSNNDTDTAIKIEQYNILYNATYDFLKPKFPWLKMGTAGLSGVYNYAGNPNADMWVSALLTNFSTKSDFFAFHTYWNDGWSINMGEWNTQQYDIILDNCTTLGVTCPQIIQSENNVYGDLNHNDSRISEYGMQIATGWLYGLNYLDKSNISLMHFIWSDVNNFTASNVFYPQNYMTVSEPLLENNYRITYNVTKGFSTYNSAGSTVYTSSSSQSAIKTVSTAKNNNYAVTIINTDTEAKNISVNLSGNYPYSTITNAETLEEYTIADNVVQVGVMDSYDIVYLISSTESPLIDFVSPTPSTGSSQTTDSFSINYTASNGFNLYSFLNLDNTLVGWYRLDSDLTDSSGYSNDGTNVGATSTSLGNFGGAYEFDGGTDYVNITDTTNFNITGDITMSTWFKVTNYTSYNRILAKSTPTNAYPYTIYGLLLDSTATNKVRMELASEGSQNVLMSSSTISEDTWYHLVGTYDSATNTARLYLNGVLDNSSTNFLSNSQIDSNNLPLTIGGSYYAGSEFNGTIDEVMLFNRTVSAEEVLGLYNSSDTEITFSSLSDLNHSVQAFVVDQNGNSNQTSVRYILTDVNAPIITIVNPVVGILEKFQPVSFRAELNELGTCQVEIYNVNYTMITTDSLSFTYSKIMEIGETTAVFYCQDLLSNSASDSVTFSMAPAFSGGGGSSAIEEVIVEEPEPLPVIIAENTTLIGNITDNLAEALSNTVDTVDRGAENLFKGLYPEDPVMRILFLILAFVIILAIVMTIAISVSADKKR